MLYIYSDILRVALVAVIAAVALSGSYEAATCDDNRLVVRVAGHMYHR